MKLVTVATHSERYFPFLLESCKRHSADLVVLGWEEKWGGFMMKVRLMKDYLSTLERDEVVCFIDAYDVILLKPLDVLEQRFRATGADVAVSMMCQYSWWVQLITRFGFGLCRRKPINAGTYVGFAGTLLDMMVNMCDVNDCSDTELDDQILLTRYCEAHADIYIDVRSDMFYVCMFSESFMPDSCILHAPGTRDLGPFLTENGYVGGELVDRKVIQYYVSYAKHWATHVAVSFLLLISFAIVVAWIIRRSLRARAALGVGRVVARRLRGVGK